MKLPKMIREHPVIVPTAIILCFLFGLALVLVGLDSASAQTGTEECEDDGAPQNVGTCRGAAYAEFTSAVSIGCVDSIAVAVTENALDRHSDNGRMTDVVDGEGDGLFANVWGTNWTQGPGGAWTVGVGYEQIQTGGPSQCSNLPDTAVVKILHDDTSSLVMSYEICNGNCTIQTLNRDAQSGAFNFYPTDTGGPDGEARSGTYRLEYEIQNTGLSGYTVSTDGDGGDEDFNMMGFIRAGATIKTFSDPLQSPIYAQGTGGPARIETLLNITPPESAIGNQDLFLEHYDTATGVVYTSENDMVNTSGEVDWSGEVEFEVDLINYPSPANLSMRVTIQDSDLSGFPWTIFSDTLTPDITHNDTSATYEGFAEVDASFLILDGEGASGIDSNFVLFNRGEVVDYNFTVQNALNEPVTRDVSVDVKSSGGTTIDTSPTQSPDADGLFADSFTIDATDPAALDEDGTQYHLAVTVDPLGCHVQGVTPSPEGCAVDTGDVFAISSLYFVDTHPQLNNTLAKDDFPNEDLNETHTFIIGEDVSYTWCHVEGVRLDDTEIDTGPNVVTITITESDGTPVSSVTRQTGADGWTTHDHSQGAVAPADIYTFKCEVSFQGNAGETTELVGFTSAFTGNKFCVLQIRGLLVVGEEVTVTCRLEINDDPLTPSVPPRFFLATMLDDFSYSYIIDDDGDPMYNVVNWTQTVKGPTYAYNFTVPDAPDFTVKIRYSIEGAEIRAQQIFFTDQGTVGASGDTMTLLEDVTGLDGQGFLAFFALVVAGMVVWSRAKDTGIRWFVGLFVMVPGFAMLSMIPEEGGEWIFLPLIGASFIMFGGYLWVRQAFDGLAARRIQ